MARLKPLPKKDTTLGSLGRHPSSRGMSWRAHAEEVYLRDLEYADWNLYATGQGWTAHPPDDDTSFDRCPDQSPRTFKRSGRWR